jgi:hypothetical protein
VNGEVVPQVERAGFGSCGRDHVASDAMDGSAVPGLYPSSEGTPSPAFFG